MKSIAEVCQDIGWDRITRSALDVLIDLVAARINDIIRTASVYSASAGWNSLGLTATCNALSAMGEDMAGLQDFCEHMPRLDPQCSDLYPRLQGAEVSRIDPETEVIEPGLVEVHHWLKHLKKKRPKLRESKHKRSRSMQVQYKDGNGANEDAIFKKPTAPAPKVKKAASCKFISRGKPYFLIWKNLNMC